MIFIFLVRKYWIVLTVDDKNHKQILRIFYSIELLNQQLKELRTNNALKTSLLIVPGNG